MKIFAISGFLGLPQDWDFLQWNHLIAIDWQAFSWESLPHWGRQFNRQIGELEQGPKVLMGYSLGGRLALHALIDRPDNWEAAIIISAHPGLVDSHEREKRKKQDQMWAKRFESEEWETLMKAWNAQEVFAQDSFQFKRKEAHYQRSQLVKALIQGSLSQQEDLRKKISALPIPILWMTGSLDNRFSCFSKDIIFSNLNSCCCQIEGAGHRVPWLQPPLFSETISHFLKHILKKSF